MYLVGKGDQVGVSDAACYRLVVEGEGRAHPGSAKSALLWNRRWPASSPAQ